MNLTCITDDSSLKFTWEFPEGSNAVKVRIACDSKRATFTINHHPQQENRVEYVGERLRQSLIVRNLNRATDSGVYQSIVTTAKNKFSSNQDIHIRVFGKKLSVFLWSFFIAFIASLSLLFAQSPANATSRSKNRSDCTQRPSHRVSQERISSSTMMATRNRCTSNGSIRTIALLPPTIRMANSKWSIIR